MTIDRHHLAASVLMAAHIPERRQIAAFLAGDATQAAPNPFARTSAGAVHHIWRHRAAEFAALDIEAAGLDGLLAAVSGLGADALLTQEILRSGQHTANVFHEGDGRRIIGAVLYGRPGVRLPAVDEAGPSAGRSERRAVRNQLDLFSHTG